MHRFSTTGIQGTASPLFFSPVLIVFFASTLLPMITKELIEEIVTGQIKQTTIFVVEITVSASNQIRVLLDTPSGISLDECVRISRAIESVLDRDQEDFELEVSSPGLSDPLRILPQYLKNLGRDVEVLLTSGIKFKGTLLSAGEIGFSITSQEKVKTPEMKRPKMESVVREILYTEVKATKVIVLFK